MHHTWKNTQVRPHGRIANIQVSMHGMRKCMRNNYVQIHMYSVHAFEHFFGISVRYVSTKVYTHTSVHTHKCVRHVYRPPRWAHQAGALRTIVFDGGGNPSHPLTTHLPT